MGLGADVVAEAPCPAVDALVLREARPDEYPDAVPAGCHAEAAHQLGADPATLPGVGDDDGAFRLVGAGDPGVAADPDEVLVGRPSHQGAERDRVVIVEVEQPHGVCAGDFAGGVLEPQVERLFGQPREKPQFAVQVVRPQGADPHRGAVRGLPGPLEVSGIAEREGDGRRVVHSRSRNSSSSSS